MILEKGKVIEEEIIDEIREEIIEEIRDEIIVEIIENIIEEINLLYESSIESTSGSWI